MTVLNDSQTSFINIRKLANTNFKKYETIQLGGKSSVNVNKVTLIADERYILDNLNNEVEIIRNDEGKVNVWKSKVEFNTSGNRKITVLGFDKSGRVVAENYIQLSIK